VRANLALREIERAILDLLHEHQGWMTRSDIARALNIDRFSGYLTGGICNDLVGRGILEYLPGLTPNQPTSYRLKEPG
jgi:hypothetical protein